MRLQCNVVSVGVKRSDRLFVEKLTKCCLHWRTDFVAPEFGVRQMEMEADHKSLTEVF